ncbi:hypothetical protein ACIQVN_35750 [Streptomyces cyaneofuscatus]|uniref:hypothetical protein n=1 Tax=Streptomyces cyaneofuscatus TaxID=66883 RepID=UPI003808B14B
MGTNGSRAVVVAGLVAGLVGAGAAAGVAAGVYAVLGRRTDPAWLRTNHAGRAVTLYAGPAAVLGGAAGIAAAPGPVRERAAGVLAVLVAGGCGAYDDLVGAEDPRRGFRAHLGALRGGGDQRGVRGGDGGLGGGGRGTSAVATSRLSIHP